MGSNRQRQDGEQPWVLVCVRGGVADVVRKPRGVALTIIDYDVEGDDRARLSQDEQGNDCFISQWDEGEVIEPSSPTGEATG